MPKAIWTTLVLILLPLLVQGLLPSSEIKLYPNTQNADTKFIFEFTVENTIPSTAYLLIVLDWFSAAITPYQCLLINQDKTLPCTNLDTPTIPLTITKEQVQSYNSLITPTKTVAISLTTPLTPLTNYRLLIQLLGVNPSIRKISPSVEMYLFSGSGLIIEQNINFGNVALLPVVTSVLQTTIITSNANNVPGSLTMLRASFRISVGISTSLSTLLFVLHSPFQFTAASTPSAFPSEKYATNAIPLYSQPVIQNFVQISPQIFQLTFDEQFLVGREFGVQITTIQNPFALQVSNCSIYSLNYNTLTPLESFERLYPLNTVSISFATTIGLPYGPELGQSLNFFKSAAQYVTLSFTVTQNVPAGYAIMIKASLATIISGTCSSSFQSLAYTTTYSYPNANTVTLRGMGPIPSLTPITITFKLQLTSSTLFFFNTYIDTEAAIDSPLTTVYLFSDREDGNALDTNSLSFSLYDNIIGDQNRVSFDSTAVASPHLRVSLSHSVSTSSGSWIDIYLPPFVTKSALFNGNTDCRMGNVASTSFCETLATANYFYISIKPLASFSSNGFPAGSTHVYLYNIRYPRATSISYIYQVYLRLYDSSTATPVTYKCAPVTLTVIPKRNALTATSTILASNIVANGYNFPNFIRFENKLSTSLNFVIQENEQRVVIIAAREGFRGLGTVLNQGSYPCASNIAVSCTYLSGSNQLNNEFEWDKIVIRFSGGQEAINSFHVIIPETVLTGSDLRYVHFIGKYNSYNKDYTALYVSNQFARSSGWTNVLPNLDATNQLSLDGKVGSYKPSVLATVKLSSSSTANPTFMVFITSWSLFEMGISTLSSSTLLTVNPSFGNNHMAPVSMYIGGGMYMTVISFLFSSSLATFNFYMSNLHLPYTYDLPTYNVYLTNPSSNTVVNYNSLDMAQAGIFYSSALRSLTMSCLDNSLGVSNTICKIQFGTHHLLLLTGSIRITFSGITIATQKCLVQTSLLATIPSTCSSDVTSQILTISLKGTGFQPAGTFLVTINGVGIKATQISQSVVLQLYDSTVNYVVQYGTRILATKSAALQPIEISQILYQYQSPLSYSKASIMFYLPRELYSDEDFGFVMGPDLNDVNTQINRLRIVLTSVATNTAIPLLFSLINAESKVVFTFDNPSSLIAGSYTLEIYGMRIPASHLNGNFQIIYQRKKDKAFTLINTISATFPALADNINSNIAITFYFNTEGFGQDLSLVIVNSVEEVTADMIWIVNFPSYYSPRLFNRSPYCTMEGAPIQCLLDTTTPYQLIIRKSPRQVIANNPYTILISGIACPRRTYLVDTFPSRYIFVGVLKNSQATFYSQTASVYPKQNIQNSATGVIFLNNLVLSGATKTTFSSLYTTLSFTCNVPIVASSILFVEFPEAFNNFHNQPLALFLKSGATLRSIAASVLNKRAIIPVDFAISASTSFIIQFTNLPTPRNPSSVSMSQISCFVTLAARQFIYASTTTSTNSAPLLTFEKSPRYISFNNDNDITITAGTYSQPIPVKSSDGVPLLTNVQISIDSAGFDFKPNLLFLSLGTAEGSFRVGSDRDLLPVAYVYNTIKQQETSTFYSSNSNMAIIVTNNPITITVPTRVDLPLGGCSKPFDISLTNAPFKGLSILFNYDNVAFNENKFWPNHHITKSELTFTYLLTTASVSFCSNTTLVGSQVPVKLILSGQNANSFKFSSDKIVFAVISPPAATLPTLTMTMINQQKTFIDVKINSNINCWCYYHIKLNSNGSETLTPTEIQVQLKAQNSVLASPSDFKTRLYTQERHEVVGQRQISAGDTTVRFSNLVAQANYTFCLFAEGLNNVVSGPFCKNFITLEWGDVYSATVTFNRTLNDVELNKVLCYFAKAAGTEVEHLVDLDGNSCGNRKVANVHYTYPGLTFSSEKKSTKIFIITDPSLSSDAAPLAFQMLFNSDLSFKLSSYNDALSTYTIDFFTPAWSDLSKVRVMTDIQSASKVRVSFDKPVYDVVSRSVTIPSVKLVGGVGSVYFSLALYKKISTISGYATVSIRFNLPPSSQQLLNCLTWANTAAEGCARAVYSSESITVVLANVQPNCTYTLYYMAASQYPLRPIVTGTVVSQTVVTYSSALTIFTSSILLLIVLVWI